MLTTRVVLLGAESSGTTTIATALTNRLRERGEVWAETACVPEYGRELTERKQFAEAERTGRRPLSVEWAPADFREVVTRQAAMEEFLARTGSPVLVCDTDAFATPVWERRYLGEERGQLDHSNLGSGDVYLLTDHDGVPFDQDGTRDGEQHREQMTRWFEVALVTHEKPWALLTGDIDARVALAERITDQAVGRKLSFSEPI